MGLTWLLVLAAVAGSAQACSTVSYATQEGGTVVSARNMDFSNLPQLSVSYVPSGLSNALIPVSGLSTYSSLGRRYNRTHNYVCITPAVQPLYNAAARVIPALRAFNISNWPGFCTDGINDAGLGISLQWQLSTNDVPAYSGSGPSLNEADVASYILANFDSVASLQAALNNGLTVSWNPLFSFATKLGFNTSFVPCHWGIWDRFNQSLVIEFSNTMNVYQNPVGVLTNNPLFQQQLQTLQGWQQMISGPPYTAPPLTPTLHGSLFSPSPGSVNSSDRFVRLAQLKSTSNLAPWSAPLNPISPGYTTESNSSNPALMAVLSLINTVFLAKDVDDSGGVGPNATDWTIFQTLRDHTKAHYMFRVGNSPRWSKIKLSNVNWAQLRAQGVVGGLLLLPDPAWARDVSNQSKPALALANTGVGRVRPCLRSCLGRVAPDDTQALTDCVHVCVQQR